MTIEDFIGKVVINHNSGKRYIITKISGAFICARDEAPDSFGNYASFKWATGTTPQNNAISNKTLVFEDNTLIDTFNKVYEEYFYTKGKDDQFLYYMSKYD